MGDDCNSLSADMLECGPPNCFPDHSTGACMSLAIEEATNRRLWPEPGQGGDEFLTPDEILSAESLGWDMNRWNDNRNLPPEESRRYWLSIIRGDEGPQVSNWDVLGSALGYTESSWNELIDTLEVGTMEEQAHVDQDIVGSGGGGGGGGGADQTLTPPDIPESSPPPPELLAIAIVEECSELTQADCEIPGNNCKYEQIRERCIWDCDTLSVDHPRCHGVPDENGAGCEPDVNVNGACTPIEEVPLTVGFEEDSAAVAEPSGEQIYSGVPHHMFYTDDLGVDPEAVTGEVFRCKTNRNDGTVLLSNSIPNIPENWIHGCSRIAKENILKERNFVNEINDLNIKINNCISWSGGDGCQDNSRITYPLDEPYVIDCSTKDCTIPSHGDAYDYCCSMGVDTQINGSIFNDETYHGPMNVWVDTNRDPPCWSNYTTGQVVEGVEPAVVDGTEWINGCTHVGKKYLDLTNQINEIQDMRLGVVQACDDVGGGEDCTIAWDPTYQEPQECLGHFSRCDDSCIKTYTVVQPQLNGGQPCQFGHGDVGQCDGGEGDCPINQDCHRIWSDCDIGCRRSYQTVHERSGTGAECPHEPSCSPGEGECPPLVPIHCQGEWSECGGNCKRSYQIILDEQNGGNLCVDPSEGDVEDCTGGECPTPAETVNCEGSWTPCGTDCIETYNITTVESGGGAACPHPDGHTIPCLPGTGNCPDSVTCETYDGCSGPGKRRLDEVACPVGGCDEDTCCVQDCVGGWSSCDPNCGQVYSVTVGQSVNGEACEADDAEERVCVPGEGLCPSINCVRPNPYPPGYSLGEGYNADLSNGGVTLTDIQCDFGYYGVPYGTYCSADGEPYGVEGCEPIVCEDLLFGASGDVPGSHHPGYEYDISDVDTSLSKHNFNINNLTCKAGWEGNPVAIPCQVHGGAIRLEGCTETSPPPPPTETTMCTDGQYIEGCEPQLCHGDSNEIPHTHCLCRSKNNPPGCVERDCISEGNPYEGCKCTVDGTGVYTPDGCTRAVCTTDANTPYGGCILPICTTTNVPFQGCIPRGGDGGAIQLNPDNVANVIQGQLSIAWWEDGDRWLREGFSNKIDRINCPSKVLNEKNCPDGHTNVNGTCHQVCRNCGYNDNTGYFGNCINPKKTKEEINEIFDDNYLYFPSVDVDIV